MAKFVVSVAGMEESNKAANFSLQVEANNVLEAVDAGKVALIGVLKGAGLGILAAPAPTPVTVDPTTPAS